MNKNIQNYNIDQIMIDIKRYFETNSSMSDEDFQNIIDKNKNIILTYNKA